MHKLLNLFIPEDFNMQLLTQCPFYQVEQDINYQQKNLAILLESQALLQQIWASTQSPLTMPEPGQPL